MFWSSFSLRFALRRRVRRVIWEGGGFGGALVLPRRAKVFLPVGLGGHASRRKLGLLISS